MLECVPSKPLVWLHGEVKSRPFSAAARIEAGYLLRLLQEGKRLGMPESRPMPGIGSNCHELRVQDANVTWRIFYGLTSDAVVILGVAAKSTRATSKNLIDVMARRWKRYLQVVEED